MTPDPDPKVRAAAYAWLAYLAASCDSHGFRVIPSDPRVVAEIRRMGGVMAQAAEAVRESTPRALRGDMARPDGKGVGSAGVATEHAHNTAPAPSEDAAELQKETEVP